MGKYQSFDEVPVWQEAARLYDRVLDLTEEAAAPMPATFRAQLERVSLSVSGLVAEAFDASKGDLISLLSNARGAALQVQSMTVLLCGRAKAARIREPLQQIRTLAESCARQLGSWRWTVENPGQRRTAGGEGSAPAPAGGSRPQGWSANAGEGRPQAQGQAGGAR